MKKLLLTASAALMMFSCQKESETTITNKEATNKRGCASQEVLDRQIQQDPTLAPRMAAIEKTCSSSHQKRSFSKWCY